MKSSDLTSMVGKFLLIFFPLFILSSGMNAQTTETFSGGTGTPGQTTGNPGALTFNTFDFTASTLSGLGAFLRPDAGGYAQFTGSRLSEITIKLNVGGNFSLDQILFEAANALTVDDDITVTGYSSNVVVSGATTTFKVPGTIGTEKSVDFTGIAAFGNVDELRISIADDGSFGGLRIESITTDAAISNPTFPVTISFEQPTWPDASAGQVEITPVTFTDNGVTFQSSEKIFINGNAASSGSQSFWPTNFSNGETFTISTTDGSEFDLQSVKFLVFDLVAGILQVEGFKDGVSTGIQNSGTGFGTTLGSKDTKNVTFTDATFDNVDSVVFTSTNSGFGWSLNLFDEFVLGVAVDPCTITNGGGGTNVTINTTIGQSFEAACTSTLSSIAMIGNGGTIGHTVSVYEGAGIGGTKLGELTNQTVVDEDVSLNDFSKTVFDFSSKNIALTAGNTYTFIVSGPVRFFADAGANYAGGTFYENGVSNGAFDMNFEIATSAVTAPSSVSLAGTVFLEGAYNGTNLNTTLNANIPSTQPYSFNGHAGGETAGSIPAGAVDWVLVELREAASAATALNNTKVGSTAGFLMNDGTIKATDGTSNLTVSLTGNTGSDFFVVIYHRNHLPIMSASAITESSSLYTIDFTGASANTYQGITGLASLSGGKFGMLAGDADGDGDVDATDLSTWQGQNGATFNYSSTKGDFNLDGEINAVDRNDFQQKNTSKTSQVPTT